MLAGTTAKLCAHVFWQHILLSNRSTLTKVNKTADVIAFYNLALHSSNSSIIAFTPDTASSIAISGGTWNMRSLQTRYPQEIRPIQTGLGTSYLVDTIIIIIIIEEASQQQ